eukprot:107421-Chlamydomonas_euryale.AAC.3
MTIGLAKFGPVCLCYAQHRPTLRGSAPCNSDSDSEHGLDWYNEAHMIAQRGRVRAPTVHLAQSCLHARCAPTGAWVLLSAPRHLVRSLTLPVIRALLSIQWTGPGFCTWMLHAVSITTYAWGLLARWTALPALLAVKCAMDDIVTHISVTPRHCFEIPTGRSLQLQIPPAFRMFQSRSLRNLGVQMS